MSKKVFFCIIIFYSCLFLTSKPFAQHIDDATALANQLGWVYSENLNNLCHGYYKIIPLPEGPTPQIPSKENYYHIKADKMFYSPKNVTRLKGHVVITQPGKELKANTGKIYRDQTGKASRLEALGNVHLIEAGKLIIADFATLDLKTDIVKLKKIIYRIARGIPSKITAAQQPADQLYARGEAETARRPAKGILDLNQATYTTCPPGNNCWKLKGSHIHLDSNSGRGSATNVRLFTNRIPFFYLPYINFPIDKRRYSGFLMPSYSFSAKKTGSVFSIPYYWNIAPNYDATITPHIMSKRGILWNGLFRYLTKYDRGDILGGIIFSDQAFKHFKNKAPNKWPSRPTLGELENASANRWELIWKDQSQFTPHLSTTVDYNNVSDAYYLRDFGKNMIDNSDNQLNRQFKVNYVSDFWNFSGNVQDYRTLHRVDQADVLNQYKRLPELNLGATAPSQFGGLIYSINTQFVNFLKDPEPGSTTKPIIGDRYNLNPEISLPLVWPYAYVTPRIQAQLTQYELKNIVPGKPNSPDYAIPIFDLKTGLFFDRPLRLFNVKYRQTLEPELYYLYIPYHDQDNLPLFDTNLYIFDYDYMFQANRFSGIDRIGDTNQATLALTTRFINDDTGDEKASASIGQIRYFKQRKIMLPSSNTDNKRLSSPLAAKAAYNFYNHWSVSGGLVWDPKFQYFDNQNFGFQYKLDSQHVLNLGYNYSRLGDTFLGAPFNSPKNDLKQTDLSIYWAMNQHFSIIGRWNYNWSHRHFLAYFYGLSYQSCCWAARFVVARTFEGLGPAPDYKRKLDTGVYVQFLLKGLGTVDNSDPRSLLTQYINGYEDRFNN
ncbi:MAG: LPS-assembly protein LptD [Gammaproteobacteria bacterium]|nr:LPS-assembly protein LptD [Gammaproteobacteria bacterium]